MERTGSFTGGSFTRAIRRRATVLLLLALGTLMLVGGGAFAGIPGSNGLISACYSRTSGALRVIDVERTPPQTCSSSTENFLSWNQRGPTGPRGATGPQGPRGA